ncbi:MAG: TetR/AcrR family transcriptional regulator [Anaerolineaceae bacterium]|nr:TetR/AcrR family transcriptional regulator [Anaerolineaceae bacterium]
MQEQEINRHQRKKIRTRKQLEKATYDLLLEKGYDAITIQDIVDRADLGRGTFYLHFRDKEEVVWSFIESSLNTTDSLAHELVARDPDKPNFEVGFVNIFNYVKENRELFEIMIGNKGHAAVTLRVQDWLARDLEREMREGFAPKPATNFPLDVTSQILTGAIIRLAIWWLENPEKYSVEEIAHLCYQSMMKGFDWQI